MKNYQFDPTEFAKLVFVLGKANGFFHHDHSKTELDRFSAEFYPLLHDVFYEVVLGKIDDRQHKALSESYPDPWDDGVSSDRAAELLAEIFKA